MKIYYCHIFIIKIYDLGLSFLPLHKGTRETLATLITLSELQECHQQHDLCDQIQQPELHPFPQ